MTKLENLPEISDRALDGLKANESLKSKILKAAVQEKRPYIHIPLRRLVPILLSSVTIMILCIFLLNEKKPIPLEEQHLIYSFTAGNSETVPVSYAEIDSLSVKYIIRCSDGKKFENDQLELLIGALRSDSVIVSDNHIFMNDQLNIYSSDGLCFTVPVQAPYIGWSDGIRRCDSFFDLLENTKD